MESDVDNRPGDDIFAIVTAVPGKLVVLFVVLVVVAVVAALWPSTRC
jgi:hypothetical protein